MRMTHPFECNGCLKRWEQICLLLLHAMHFWILDLHQKHAKNITPDLEHHDALKWVSPHTTCNQCSSTPCVAAYCVMPGIYCSGHLCGCVAACVWSPVRLQHIPVWVQHFIVPFSCSVVLCPFLPGILWNPFVCSIARGASLHVACYNGLLQVCDALRPRTVRASLKGEEYWEEQHK